MWQAKRSRGVRESVSLLRMDLPNNSTSLIWKWKRAKEEIGTFGMNYIRLRHFETEIRLEKKFDSSDSINLF